MSANKPNPDLTGVDDFDDLVGATSDTPVVGASDADDPLAGGEGTNGGGGEPSAAAEAGNDPFMELFGDDAALDAAFAPPEAETTAPAPASEPAPATAPEPTPAEPEVLGGDEGDALADLFADDEALDAAFAPPAEGSAPAADEAPAPVAETPALAPEPQPIEVAPAADQPTPEPVAPEPEPEAPAAVLQAQPAPAAPAMTPEAIQALVATSLAQTLESTLQGLTSSMNEIRGGLDHINERVDSIQSQADTPQLAALPPARDPEAVDTPVAAEPTPIAAEPMPAAAAVPVAQEAAPPVEPTPVAPEAAVAMDAPAPAQERDPLDDLFSDDLTSAPLEAEVVAHEPVHDPAPVAEPAADEDHDTARQARVRAAQANAEAQRLRLLDTALDRLEAKEQLTPMDEEILVANGIELPDVEPPAPAADDMANDPMYAPEAELYSPEPAPGYAAEPAPEAGHYDDVAPVGYDDEGHAPPPAEDDDGQYGHGEDFSHLAGTDDGYADAQNGAHPDFDPVDVLWAVGVRDSDAEEVLRSTHALDQMRKEARETTRKRRRSGGRVKLPRLPFSSLAGDPLVMAVFSPKGGAGKSTTSVNMGALLAASGAATAGKDQEPPRILVMDGDIANGNLAIRVANTLEPNLLDLIEWMDANGDLTEYDNEHASASMRDFVLWHEDLPNLNILAAPDNPEAFEDFDVADFERILNMVGKFYDVIIIDCGTEVVMRSNQTWLRHSNQVFLLTLPERAALHSAGKAARVITRAGAGRPTLVSPDRLHIVMMRSDADLGFDPRHGVKATFDWADSEHVSYFRDYDQETARANNASQFLSLENPDYAEDISGLVSAAFKHHQNNRRPSRR